MLQRIECNFFPSPDRFWGFTHYISGSKSLISEIFDVFYERKSEVGASVHGDVMLRQWFCYLFLI